MCLRLFVVKKVIKFVQSCHTAQSCHIFLFACRLFHLHFRRISGRRTLFLPVALSLSLESDGTMSSDMGMNVPGSCVGRKPSRTAERSLRYSCERSPVRILIVRAVYFYLSAVRVVPPR